ALAALIAAPPWTAFDLGSPLDRARGRSAGGSLAALLPGRPGGARPYVLPIRGVAARAPGGGPRRPAAAPGTSFPTRPPGSHNGPGSDTSPARRRRHVQDGIPARRGLRPRRRAPGPRGGPVAAAPGRAAGRRGRAAGGPGPVARLHGGTPGAQ